MSSVNKIIIIGRMGRDPSVKFLESGTAIAEFSVATNRIDKEKTTDWHECVAFGKVAEIIGEYLKKGDQAYFEGELQYSVWKDEKTGKDRKKAQVVVRQIQMLGSKKAQEDTPF